MKPFIDTSTFDNGKEFAHHELMASQLGADIYFAQPYHSWERGTNENRTWLTLHFIPRFMRLDVQYIEDNLNNRPR